MEAPDPRTEILLRALDQAFERSSWHGTTLKGSLRGMRPEMAIWKPSPTRHSIWEYLLHAAFWKFVARRALVGFVGNTFERKPQDWPRVPAEPTAKALERDVDYLKKEHRQLREVVAAFPADRLMERLGPKKPLAISLIQGVTAHDLYHCGQMQLLKRLYREAHPEADGGVR